MTSGISINDPGRSLAEGREAAGEWGPVDPKVREAVPTPASRRSEVPPPLHVGAIMTRDPRTCRPDDTLAAAAMAMCEADCRFLPVVDVGGHPIGVLTDGDVCLIGSTSHRRLSDMYVRDAMGGPPATCRSGDDVLDALRIMRERRIRHLPVVGAQGILDGVLSLTDIVLEAEEDEGSPALRREVSATLREIVQKRGNKRVIEENPFFED